MQSVHDVKFSSFCNGLYVEDLYQFERPGIGSILTYSAIEGVLLLLLVVTIEVLYTN